MSKEVNQNGSFSFNFVCCGTCDHDYLGEDEIKEVIYFTNKVSRKQEYQNKRYFCFFLFLIELNEDTNYVKEGDAS